MVRPFTGDRGTVVDSTFEHQVPGVVWDDGMGGGKPEHLIFGSSLKHLNALERLAELDG